MAVITYGTDVAPHLRRGLMYRRLRMKRWEVLHRRNYEYWEEYDPYGWVEKAPILDLLAGVFLIVFFHVTDSGMFKLFRSGRLHAMPGTTSRLQ
jgi:hypothetical protein